MHYKHNRSQQRTDQRVLVLTLKFLAVKKPTGFSTIKNASQIFFDFFYIYSMQRFSADIKIFSEKIYIYFCPWKRTSKVAHNRPQTFFSQYCLAAQTSPELIFHIINMSQGSSVSLSVIIMHLCFTKKLHKFLYFENTRECQKKK